MKVPFRPWHRMTVVSGIFNLLLCITLLPRVHSFAAITTHPSGSSANRAISIVICPGFGNAVVDYVAPLGASPEHGFKSVLERRGFDVHIVPVERYDWIRVALGLFDVRFWQSNQLPTGWAYGWYLQRTLDTIEKAAAAAAEKYDSSSAQQQQAASVLVVAHSAGGWLARAALGEQQRRVNSSSSSSASTTGDVVCGLVTLGAPHFPPPDGINCATRGALKNTNLEYPGAYRKDIVYVTVAGNAVTGGLSYQDSDEGQRAAAVDEIYARRGEGSARNVARINYEALLGEFEGVQGDGVIPIPIAHLDGSEQITLDGVLHSINEAGTTLPTDSWYGSEKVVDQWLSRTLKKLNIVAQMEASSTVN